jgi:hypothetical protein
MVSNFYLLEAQLLLKSQKYKDILILIKINLSLQFLKILGDIKQIILLSIHKQLIKIQQHMSLVLMMIMMLNQLHIH